MLSQFSLLLMSNAAQADEYLDTLKKAEDLLKEGKYQECIDTVDEARLLMDKGMAKTKPSKDGEEGIVYSPENIASLYLYRGNSRYLQNKEDGLEDWRKALIIDPYLEWNENLVTDSEAWDIFWPSKAKFGTRNEIDIGIPEKNGRAVIFVDGVQRLEGDTVPEGEHFVQVKCPKGDIQSFTRLFRKPIKWHKTCPYKYDVNEEVEVVIESEWDAFGPAFGNTESTNRYQRRDLHYN